MRLTLHDVAREAGVSTATVDRVLNNRSGVRSRTREIVVDTARRLGYVSEASTGASDAQRIPALRSGLILCCPGARTCSFEPSSSNWRRRAAARLEVEVEIASIEGFNPDTLASALTGCEGRTNGVGVIALDHPRFEKPFGDCRRRA